MVESVGVQLDPDLIVHTSGETRLSGFLPWQSSSGNGASAVERP